MLNINAVHVKILKKIQVCYTNRNIIMNFVGNNGESEPWEFFTLLCTCERRRTGKWRAAISTPAMLSVIFQSCKFQSPRSALIEIRGGQGLSNLSLHRAAKMLVFSISYRGCLKKVVSETAYFVSSGTKYSISIY